MKSINLLPKEEKKRDVKGIVLNVLMVLVILFFASTILLTLFLFDMDDSISAKLSKYEATNMKVQNYVTQLKSYSDFKSKVDSKTKIIEDIKRDEVIWSKVIYDIGKLMPEEAYIDFFEARGSGLYKYIEDYEEGSAEEGGQVISFIVIGQASSYVDVLKFAIELKKIENMKEVWISGINRNVVPDLEIQVVDFTIETYWDLEPYLEGITKKQTEDEEDVLDSELTEMQ